MSTPLFEDIGVEMNDAETELSDEHARLSLRTCGQGQRQPLQSPRRWM